MCFFSVYNGFVAGSTGLQTGEQVSTTDRTYVQVNSLLMGWYSKLEHCQKRRDFSDHEIAELTGTSHTQVRRWREREAEPTGVQAAILEALVEWIGSNTLGGKPYLLSILRKQGHRNALELLFCQR